MEYTGKERRRVNISLKILAEELSMVCQGVEYKEKGEHNINSVELYTGGSGKNRNSVLYVCTDTFGNLCDKRKRQELPDRDCCVLLSGGGKDLRETYKNYIWVPGKQEMTELLVCLQNMIIRLLQWQSDISQAALQTFDFQQTLNLSDEVFSNGTILISFAHDLVFRSRAAADDFSFNKEVFYHSCYETESRTLSVFPCAAELQRLNKTSILHGEKGGNFIACNVTCDKIRTGILLTPLGREGEKERFSIYLNSLAEVCAKMYEKAINNPEADQGLHRNDPFLLRLISGDRPSAEEIEEYCGEANGLEDGHTLHICVIRALPFAEAEFERNIILYRNIISRIFTRSHILVYRKQIVLIRDFTSNQLSGESPDALECLERLLRRIHAVMGSSAPFSDLSRANSFYRQAETVAAGTAKTGEGSSSPHDYPGYLLYDLISSFAKGHTLRHYIHPDIIRLSEEDRSGRSGFLYTLYLYLLNDRSYGICSEKLHIHRSSFAYRIQKIRKVISGDLNDENVRLSLILSICMYWCLHPEEDPTGISRWMQ